MGFLKVAGLVKAFGAIRAVDSVRFEVRPGEIYGLLGPNGAGKTTAISIIAGLLKPDAGEVFVAGASIWSDPQRAKSMMGVVPQDLALYEELTGREKPRVLGPHRGSRVRGIEVARDGIIGGTLIDGSGQGRRQDLFGRDEATHQSRVRPAPPPENCSCSTNRPWASTRKRG